MRHIAKSEYDADATHRRNFADASRRALGLDPVPVKYDRAHRVLLIGLAAKALVDSGTEAGLFTGAALLDWLQNGGNLEAKHLQVVQRGSHRTASRIWAGLIGNERQDAEAEPTLAPQPPESRTK